MQDIRQASTLLQAISQGKVKRMAYEARQAEIMDQRLCWSAQGRPG